MALAFNKFQCFVENVAEKVHNLGSDTLKLMLTNTLPVNTNTVIGNITEITTGSGYSAGGPTLSVTTSAQTSGTYKLVVTDITVLASGGTIGPFRYIVLWNDTSAADSLIGWWDRASALTLNDGDSYVLDFDGTNGILQIT